MPDIWMDVDTAVTVPCNIAPLVATSDFKTVADNTIAYNETGLEVYWNFVTTAGAMTTTPITPTTSGSYDWTHVDGGMYKIEIPASGGASANNDTEGFGWISGACPGGTPEIMPFRGPTIGFRAAALNNSFVDGATVDVNVTAMANNVITANAINADAITNAKIADDAIAAENLATGALTADAFAADAIVAVTLAKGALTADAFATDALVAATFATNSITADALATDAVTELTDAMQVIFTDTLDDMADAVWNEALSGHTTAGTAGKAVSDVLADTGTDGVIVATGGITAASIATGAIDADALAADFVDEILDEQIGDGTVTMRQALRVILAALAGKLSGAATTTVTIRNTADSANVIVATVDADGNRSAVTVTP